jgi:hypothetical protein
VPKVTSSKCLVKVIGYNAKGHLEGTAQSASPFTIH